MKTYRNLLMVMTILCLSIGASPSLRAEAGADPAKAATPAVTPGEVASRLQGLQDEMDRIQGEMASLKKQLGVGSTSATSAAPTTQAAQTESTPAGAFAKTAATDSTGPSLASILGPINVTGFVDGYYSYNFNHPRQPVTGPSFLSPTPGLSGPFISSFRTFDGPANQFSLNMAELTVAKAPDASNSRLGFNLTFGFGNAMNVVNSSNGPQELGFAQYLKEAYLSYLVPVGKGLQVDFGKFVTPAGAEVIETKDNWNYSRGLLFNYAIPFYHFGLRGKYAFSDKFALTGYAVNGWNNIIGLNTGKTYGASAAWTPTKKVSITQTYLGGPQMVGITSKPRHLSDTVVTYSPTSKLSLMANYDYGRGDQNPVASNPRSAVWQGVAAYARYALNERFALASRYEYFDDRDGFMTGTAQSFNEFTGTFEHTIAKHLISRWEYRRDMSNRDTFLKGGSAAIDHQDTFSIGLVYVFDMKELH